MGWFLLILCAYVLISNYGVWGGIFLILSFVWNIFGRIIWKNHKINTKDACKEFFIL